MANKYYRKEVYWCENLDRVCVDEPYPNCNECKYNNYGRND
jgi:hypothetical protein